MTRKQNLAAALVTTASVALLAGAANAQNGTQGMGPGDARSGVAYCSSTQMSPAFNNCVMPAASAPGGGSFPGSFLVPGTNTSFAVHGIVFAQMMHQFGPVQPQGGLIAVPSSATAYQGPGVAQNGLNLHALNGGTSFDSGPTRPNIETRTPTGYGELKTYIEFDFNESNAGQNGTSQIPGNMGLVRMRQAYGTLGPWLMGQTKTLLDDVQTYPDLGDAGLDFGMRTSTRVHKPQVRYTWLGGGGLTVAASAEEPTADAIQQFSTGGTTTSSIEDNVGASSATSIVQIPDLVLATQWDQPWGHLRFAGAYHDSRLDNTGGILPASPNPSSGERSDVGGYFFGLTGHLNTWGKDALRGGMSIEKDFADSESPYINERYINNSTGARGNVNAWDFYANYEHFWSDQWRSNVSGGWLQTFGIGSVFQPGVIAGVGTANNLAADTAFRRGYSAHMNVIFSPVPQTDFIVEWDHAYIDTYAGSSTRSDRLLTQFKFYF
jgi:hypothetical protein